MAGGMRRSRVIAVGPGADDLAQERGPQRTWARPIAVTKGDWLRGEGMPSIASRSPSRCLSQILPLCRNATLGLTTGKRFIDEGARIPRLRVLEKEAQDLFGGVRTAGVGVGAD